MSEAIIRACDVSKTYGSGPSAVSALAGVNLGIEAGECVALLGKSGSGKSTLMNLTGGLDVPTSGTLTVSGRNLGELSRSQLADYRRDCIGFIFQSFHLIAGRTVQENVELPLMLAGAGAKERQRRSRAILDAVGLSHRLTHKPPQLSGGERQRVAVARALANQPAVLLADEPTGNLDTASATGVMELLFAQVRERGMTLLLVTHDEELAKRYTTRIIRVQDGRIRA